MSKILLILVLVFSATCLLAQGGEMTIQGCLSNAKGQYWLTDSNGVKHQLSSHANVLKQHIGHEVAITGTEAVKTTDTTIQGGASSAKQIPVFRVKSVQHVADTCKTM